MDPQLVLVPTFIGQPDPADLPEHSIQICHLIRCFIVEREKTARAFLKAIAHPIPQSELRIHEMDKHGKYDNFHAFFDREIENGPIGLLSEAGLPAVADPGSKVVRYAHQKAIPVLPLSGSSSIFLALMASGMDGQHFHFSGYLPIDQKARIQAVKKLEQQASKATQIFMETPYRNNAFLQLLLKQLRPDTRLCVASALETPDQRIWSMPVLQWKKQVPDLHKLPCIYLIKRD